MQPVHSSVVNSEFECFIGGSKQQGSYVSRCLEPLTKHETGVVRKRVQCNKLAAVTSGLINYS